MRYMFSILPVKIFFVLQSGPLYTESREWKHVTMKTEFSLLRQQHPSPPEMKFYRNTFCLNLWHNVKRTFHNFKFFSPSVALALFWSIL